MSNLEKMFDDQKDNAQQKYNNRNFIDTMHHPQIKVDMPVRIFFTKEIAKHLPQGKKLANIFLFIFGSLMIFTHR